MVHDTKYKVESNYMFISKKPLCQAPLQMMMNILIYCQANSYTVVLAETLSRAFLQDDETFEELFGAPLCQCLMKS